MRKIIIILMSLMLTVCASNPKPQGPSKPRWMTNPEADYPNSMYMTAIGSGDTRSKAEDNAMSKMSRIFEAKVSSDETYIEKYNEIVSQTEGISMTQTDITTNVKIKSQQSLINVQFGEAYTDPSGTVNIIAYIDRMRTADIYEGRISENSEKIMEYVSSAKSTSDLFKKYALYNAAHIFGINNQGLIQQLGIISPTMKDFVEPEYNLANILNMKNDTARSLVFDVSVKNDNSNQIKNMLINALGKYGFQTKNNGKLKVVADVNVENSDLGKGDKYYVRYNLLVKMLNEQNKSIVTMDEKGREAHVTQNEAVERAYREMAKKIKKGFMKEFDDFINSYLF